MTNPDEVFDNVTEEVLVDETPVVEGSTPEVDADEDLDEEEDED